MGYYVSIDEGSFKIKHENMDAALDTLKVLNATTPASKKRGGGWHGGKQTGAWFSWMPESFDHYESVTEALSDMGFEYMFDERGDLVVNGYDSKIGQEDEMIDAIAHLIEDGAVYWRGEEGDHWAWVFENGVRSIKTARIVYE